MTRPTLEKKYESLTKQIWRDDLGQSGELTVSREETMSGGKSFMITAATGTNSTQIHRSFFEDYFNAVGSEPKRIVREKIKTRLEQLL